MLLAALHPTRLWHRRRLYRSGATITRFIAKDVRRGVEVMDAAQIGSGMPVVRTRTWNVLYTLKGIEPQRPFGDVRTVHINELWKRPGESWAGPVPSSSDE